jgi:hypothetical protein
VSLLVTTDKFLLFKSSQSLRTEFLLNNIFKISVRTSEEIYNMTHSWS